MGPFQPSGFRHGAKCCMGALRGDAFLFAALGAGRRQAASLFCNSARSSPQQRTARSSQGWFAAPPRAENTT